MEGQFDRTVRVEADKLVIEIPLDEIAAILERYTSDTLPELRKSGDDEGELGYQVLDKQTFGSYLARYMTSDATHWDLDLWDEINGAIFEIADDAAFMGAGIKRIEPAPHDAAPGHPALNLQVLTDKHSVTPSAIEREQAIHLISTGLPRKDLERVFSRSRNQQDAWFLEEDFTVGMPIRRIVREAGFKWDADWLSEHWFELAEEAAKRACSRSVQA